MVPGRTITTDPMPNRDVYQLYLTLKVNMGSSKTGYPRETVKFMNSNLLAVTKSNDHTIFGD